jgi:hypothetical protein
MIWWRRASCPSFPIDRLEACSTGLYEASGATAGSPSSVSYTHSQKCFMNGVALLDKPAVAPTCQSLITFENCYRFSAGLLHMSWEKLSPRSPAKTSHFFEECVASASSGIAPLLIVPLTTFSRTPEYGPITESMTSTFFHLRY